MFHGFVPQWGPLFWELSGHSAEDLLQSGDEWQQTLAVLRAQGDEAAAFERVYIEALRRLEALGGQDRVRWHDLMRIILSWALWRRPRQEGETLLAAALATQANVDRQKEVKLMGQTIAESLWEEGRLKGQLEGELKIARRLLQQLLANHFGAVPEAVLQQIEAVPDVDRLTAAALQISKLATPEDLQL
jgi:predicted transposase YdaD